MAAARASTGCASAEVIRRAIRLYEPERKRDRNFVLVRIAEGPGGSIADVPEGDLVEGFGDWRSSLTPLRLSLSPTGETTSASPSSWCSEKSRASSSFQLPSPLKSTTCSVPGSGLVARLAFIEDLVAGRFVIAHLEADEHRVVADLERRYEYLDAGLADLGVIVAAERHQTPRLLTFDERHFRALRPLGGGRFTLLPADEPTR
jgi:hypothetical protein